MIRTADGVCEKAVLVGRAGNGLFFMVGKGSLEKSNFSFFLDQKLVLYILTTKYRRQKCKFAEVSLRTEVSGRKSVNEIKPILLKCITNL